MYQNNKTSTKKELTLAEKEQRKILKKQRRQERLERLKQSPDLLSVVKKFNKYCQNNNIKPIVNDIQRSIDEFHSTLSFVVIQLLWWGSEFKATKSFNFSYSQIAYICKCSESLVEKIVYKLKKAGILTHELNKKKDKKNNLTRAKREKYGCNPFKWVFKFIEKISNTLLIALKFRKIKWLINRNKVKQTSSGDIKYAPNGEIYYT